jgi:two-component system LytT family response regulator
VGECRNGEEVLRALEVNNPDVIFLDIQMPGFDGFEVIRRRTPEQMPAVVFLTAYDQYAIRAFDAQALDYLVKPVSAARFGKTIKRLVRQLSLTATPVREESLIVTTPRGKTVLRLREIDWIEAADNYARLWIGGRSYLLRESLQLLEERVRATGFVRAHRKALVRLDGVRELRTEAAGLMAKLDCGASIPISRRRRREFTAAVRKLGRSSV